MAPKCACNRSWPRLAFASLAPLLAAAWPQRAPLPRWPPGLPPPDPWLASHPLPAAPPGRRANPRLASIARMRSARQRAWTAPAARRFAHAAPDPRRHALRLPPPPAAPQVPEPLAPPELALLGPGPPRPRKYAGCSRPPSRVHPHPETA